MNLIYDWTNDTTCEFYSHMKKEETRHMKICQIFEMFLSDLHEISKNSPTFSPIETLSVSIKMARK